MHTHEHASPDSETGWKRMGWTVLLNIVITVAEYAGGIMSGSLALISDAGHNLSDVLSLIVGYIGERVSEKNATKKHSFGFKRTEIFTALINALALLAIAAYIMFEAVERMGERNTISLPVMLGVGSIGLLGNLASILILNREKESSVNMKAAYLHLFYDTLSSVFVILAAIIIYFTGNAVVDIVASGIISLMILYSGMEVIKKTIHILMQGIPEGIDFDDVYTSLKSIHGVESVHRLHIWAVNSRETFLSVHVCVDDEGSKNTDKVIKEINDMLAEKYFINHTTIQVEKSRLCDDGALCGK
ncbi:cation transporter [Candidatus Woesearchaeota archaeon]|nr:MAG: cation transporter [Candidatus Woesearchaeota archaeon]